MIVDKACFERGCACYDSRFDGPGVEVVERKGENVTDDEIHNIYIHMSGKAEGIAEVAGTADFPVLFARAILEFARLKENQ